jgi:DNA-binding NtrC family response regulator
MATASWPSTRLLIVDDDDQLRQTLAQRFQRLGMAVTTAAHGEEALARAGQTRWDIALLDLHLPGMSGIELLARLKERQPELEALLLTAHGSIETAIQAMKQGAYDYLTKPFHLPEMEIHLRKAYEKVQLARRARQWVEQLECESARYQLVGSSPAMQKVVHLLQRVAPADTTVLVQGASGTGKELVARALHYNSPRHDQPLVTVNCAALPATLLESELFGHEKGAFTGAVQAKRGLVEVAEGGTLFIDEVAEMAGGLQAKLLRLLEDGHYRRVGGTQEHRADVRVVAATNRALGREIQAGRFREDLYYRVNVVTIDLPPLRDRRQDIPALVEHFLATRQIGPVRSQVEPAALEALVHYDWPGNVRELANVLERAQILAEGHRITLSDLPANLFEALPAVPGTCAGSCSLGEIECRHVRHVLRQENGNKVHAARALGISRRALYRLLDKYHLEGCHGTQGAAIPERV